MVIREDDGSVRLAANRDEYYDRPTDEPVEWPVRPAVWAGRDRVAGGTWLAVNECGVVAAVTNRPTLDGHDPARPSRGQLPLLACRHASAAAAAGAFTEHLARTRYNGFNLFVCDHSSAAVFESPCGESVARPVGPGVHVVGNGAWDDPSDPRVARALAVLAGRTDSEALKAVCRDHAVLAGAPPLCVHGPLAGTRSSTILLLASDGALAAYHHASGPPCVTPYRLLPFVL